MSDQRRVSQRKSTIKNSQKIENILKEREIKAQKKNSKKLGSIIQGQLKSFEEEAHEVIDLAESLPEDAALAADNIEIEESNLDPGSGLNLENQAQIVDPLGALTPGVIRSRSVSTEVNRLECGTASSATPERARLDNNLSPIRQDNLLNINLSIVDEVFEDKMDDNIYKEKLKQAKLYRRQFNTLLSTFTAEDVVSIVHKHICEKKLSDIGVKFIEICDWFDTLIIDLQENNEEGRVTEIETIQNEIKSLKRENEKVILNKISELVSGNPESAAHTMSVRSDSEASARSENKKLEELKAKAGIKKSFIEDKVKTLRQKIKSFKAPVEMTNDEVRFAIKECKTWEKKYDEIIVEQQKYYEECVPFDDLEEAKEQVRAIIETLQDTISDKVSLLYVEDETRGLSCRSENRSKDTVVFPSPFKGDLGENVYKFIEEIKSAIIDSQIKNPTRLRH